MAHWTAEQWTAVLTAGIGAIGAAIASIVAAARINAHEANSRLRHRHMLRTVGAVPEAECEAEEDSKA